MIFAVSRSFKISCKRRFFMSKKGRSKRILFVVLSCALLISSVCMIALNNKVTYASSVASSLAMEEGASVRISNEVNGIKYTMTMSETEDDCNHRYYL